MDSITNFLNDFQDMYVDRQISLSSLNYNLSNIELRFLEKQLKGVVAELTELNTLSLAASDKAVEHYLRLIEILENKIDYISDTADVYSYVNSYFDSRTVKDLHNFNIRSIKTDSCIFDSNQKAISLKSISSLYKCSKTIEDNSITFYNTNNSSHTGLHIVSPYLDLLTITQLIIRKADGTVLELEVSVTDDRGYYINHEDLISAQIIIKFETKNGVLTLPEYLETVDLNLIDYEYKSEGHVPLETTELRASNLFSLIIDSVIPLNTFANVDVGLELLDVNNNILDSINTTIAINNSLVCKRLDRVNFNEVGKIDSLLINGKKTKSNLKRDYLESMEFKNSKYLLYYPKDLQENILNKYLVKLGQSSFKVNTKIVKNIRVTPALEMYSFQKGVSPLIKHITGVTKNETI